MQNQVRGILIAVVAQFILGLVINLFGVPLDDPTYATKSFLVKAAFPAHTVNGISLFILSIWLLMTSSRSRHEEWRSSAIWGFVFVLTATVGGLTTLMLQDEGAEIASFIMSIGLLGALFAYLRYYYLTS